MSDGTPVFFVERTKEVALFLRRYRDSDGCAGKLGYCNAQVYLCNAPAVRDEKGYYQHDVTGQGPSREDPRWPTVCTACGRSFTADDRFQVFQDPIMRAADGREFRQRELPPGACYEAFWEDRTGPDGRALIVITPSGRLWSIDSRASNCTLPQDNVHRCWVRHGRPEDGTLHVDKNGHTCQAGAGSIDVPGYHGFLHHGKFTPGI